MTAIITPTLRKQLAADLFQSFNDSDNYYIAIGRSEEWNQTDTPPTPLISAREERLARESLQSAMVANDCSYVVPRYNWSPGTIYSAYNDNYEDYPSNAYYVLTQANAVYLCLSRGKNSQGVPVVSSVEPQGNSTKPFKTADGYIWKFLYSMGAADTNKFLSANYMPVKRVTVTNSFTDTEQKAVQDSAVAGQIASFDVIEAGAGYVSPPTVVIQGDGTGARATAHVVGGAVTKIEIDDSAGVILMGSGYNKAHISFAGGSPTTPAVARAILPPERGYGYDPRNDLRSTALMFNAKPAGKQGNDFIIGNDFRQIVLMKNPKKYGTDSDFTGITGTFLTKITTADNFQSANYVNNGIITGSYSGAKAIIDYVDSDYIMVHQTEETGYKSFKDSGTTDDLSGPGMDIVVLDSVRSPEIDPYKGSILLIDNRNSIFRAIDQTEDLKPIIQF